MKKLYYLLILLISSNFLLAQPQDPAAKNLSLLGHLSYSNDLNDVWAYVDSAGNEYALVGTTVGLSIVDLKDPTNPTEIHFIPGDTSIWRDMHVFKNFAYTSNETGSGTLIVDLSGLPEEIVFKDTILGGSSTAHNLWIEDGYLYTIGFLGASGFLVFDLNNDPWNPEFTGFYIDRYVHDLYVRGNLGYSAEVFAGFLTVLDLTDKSNPQVIATHTYPGAFTHATWLNDAGDVCFTMDELSRAYTIAWDVSDPTDIKELDRIQSSLSHGYAAPHNVHVNQDFLISSVYADGVQVVDVSRPGNMIEVGHYDTSPRVGAGLRGCWGTYPFLPSGVVLASDMAEGLFVLQPEYQRACYLEGKVTIASSGVPLSNVEIDIVGTDVLELSKTTGEYATGIADSGMYQVTFSRYGFNREIRNIPLQNGVLHVENVELTPSTFTDLEIEVLEAGSNEPIADAMIEIVSTGGFQRLLQSDLQGSATEADFLTGGYQVHVGKWGYQTISQAVEITESLNKVVFYLEDGYYDDFTFDFNWVAPGTAASGNWTRGIPFGTFLDGYMFNPDFDSRNDISNKAYMTGNANSPDPSLDEVENGKPILFSPIFDLSGYVDPVISFEYWFTKFNNTGGSNANDTLTVKLLSGSEEIILGKYAKSLPIWREIQIRILDSIPLSSSNFLILEIEDNSPFGLLEAGIDHFEVIETGSTTNLEENIAEVQFNIYPIPAQDRLWVDYDLIKTNPNEEVFFEILDLQGRVLRQEKLNSANGKQAVNLDLPSGLYLGNLRVNGRLIKSIKWTKL